MRATERDEASCVGAAVVWRSIGAGFAGTAITRRVPGSKRRLAGAAIVHCGLRLVRRLVERDAFRIEIDPGSRHGRSRLCI
jgi:hypothetical protein